jgi:hypothetical protein
MVSPSLYDFGCGSAVARLLRLLVRSPPLTWMFDVIVVYCKVEALRRADHSYRGFLPNVEGRCV